MTNDVFANIAAKGIGGRRELLCDPKPIKFDKKVCELNNCDLNPHNRKKKISTKSELYNELKSLKKYYEPFMQDFAPKIAEYNNREYINNFVLDGKKIIKIPEYGGPVGYAKKTYETDFNITEIKKEKAYFIKFLGADYKAYVYINSVCVGMHKGFFHRLNLK